MWVVPRQICYIIRSNRMVQKQQNNKNIDYWERFIFILCSLTFYSNLEVTCVVVSTAINSLTRNQYLSNSKLTPRLRITSNFRHISRVISGRRVLPSSHSKGLFWLGIQCLAIRTDFKDWCFFVYKYLFGG